MFKKSIFFLSLLPAMIAGAFFIHSGPLSAAEPDLASSASYTWPYNEGSDISFDEADVKTAWEAWKARTIRSSNNGTKRVMGGVNNSSTVSEGMAYGMLFAGIFDEQDLFDDLWRFAKAHLNDRGLMAWWIGGYEEIWDGAAATDAEEDMAIALINACVKVDKGAWSASSHGIDYCLEAEKMIDAIWRFEIDKPGNQRGEEVGVINDKGYELLPGDTWNVGTGFSTNGMTNISYFAPSYYEVYQKFMNNSGYTGNNGFTPVGDHSKWAKVIERQYEISDLIQAQPDNCSNLVPNWHNYNGVSTYPGLTHTTQTYSLWGSDAARFAWRVGLDKLWYNRAEARETSNELGSFFATVGIDNTGREYRMNGTSVNSWNNVFHFATAAAAIYAADSLNPISCGAANGQISPGENKQKAYNKILNNPANDYYKDAWRLLTMLTMTGNFPNFYELDGETPIPPGPADTVSSCRVAYEIGETWTNGYNATLTVTNEGNNSIDGYTLKWTFNDGQAITGSWSTNQANQEGNDVTVKTFATHPWNGTITPGGNIQFGVTVRASSQAIPNGFKLNDTMCTSDGSTPGPGPGPGPDTEPPVTNNCSVAYIIGDAWANGYNATIKVTNEDSSSIEGYNLKWTFNDGQTVDSSWNVDSVTQAGNQFTARTDVNSQDNGWNSTIAPNGTIEFGITVSASSQVAPSNFTLNGAACNQDSTPTPDPDLNPDPPTPDSTCSVIYDVLVQWNSGFTAVAKLTNSGPQVDNWKLKWTYAGDQQIGPMWGATHTQNGSNVVVDAPSSWGSILENQTVEFNFNGTYNSGNPAPNTFTLSSSNAADQVCQSVSTAALSTQPPTTDGQTELIQPPADNRSYIFVPVISQ